MVEVSIPFIIVAIVDIILLFYALTCEDTKGLAGSQRVWAIIIWVVFSLVLWLIYGGIFWW